MASGSLHLCDVCSREFSCVSNLNRHKKSHHMNGLESFPCNVCDKVYSRLDNLNQHIKKFHSGTEFGGGKKKEEKAHPCSFCNKSYAERKTLLRHMRNVHDTARNEKENDTVNPDPDDPDSIASDSESSNKRVKYSCPHCDSSYANKPNLNRHMKEKHPVAAAMAEECKEKKMHCPVLAKDCEEIWREKPEGPEDPDKPLRCKGRFLNIDLLCKHLKDVHGLEDEVQTLEFSTMLEFRNWKETMERENVCSYVMSHGAQKVREGKRYNFYCHRSGVFHPRGLMPHRNRRLRTVKMGAMCPARLIVTEGQSVTVSWHKVHCGHNCGIQYLKLTASERAAIKSKLESGVSWRRVLNDIRDSVNEDAEYTRLHSAEPRDMWNILKAIQSKEYRPHANDAVSVDMIVQGLQNKPKNPVVFFKKQGIECSCSDSSCALEKDDFMLVLCTPWQKSMAKHLKEKVLIDSTHGTNSYDFELTTVMSVDEFGSGVPISYCLSNKIDGVTMAKYFREMKAVLGGAVQSKLFMSDLADSFYNAWAQEMGECAYRLWCSWHVHRSWRKQLTKIPDILERAVVYGDCISLMNILDRDLFEVELLGCLDAWLTNPVTKLFGEYFRDHYVPHKEKWALWYRAGLGLNTNMYLESLHKTLKHSYMGGRNMKRVDRCIEILLRLTKDESFKWLIRSTKGNNSSRQSRINDSHKKCMIEETFKVVVEKVPAVSWLVKSSKSDINYEVKINPACECDGCELYCSKCRVCHHEYICTCLDHSSRSNVCKHIHAVAQVSSGGSNNSSRDDVLAEKVQEKIQTLVDTISEVPHVGGAVCKNDEVSAMLLNIEQLVSGMSQDTEVFSRLRSFLDFLMARRRQISSQPPSVVSDCNIPSSNQKCPVKSVMSTTPQSSSLTPVSPVHLSPSRTFKLHNMPAASQSKTPVHSGLKTPTTEKASPSLTPGSPAPFSPSNKCITPQRKSGFYSTKKKAPKKGLDFSNKLSLMEEGFRRASYVQRGLELRASSAENPGP